MKNFVVYKTTTGEILRTGTAPDDMLAIQAQTGETVVEDTANQATEYYSASVKTARPLLTTVATWSALTLVANGVATVTLGSALPNPTAITITPPPNLGIALIPEQTVTDGSFVLSTTVAGAYTVTARAFPYQDYTVTINGT